MADSWRRWRDDVFGDPYLVWHDGADYTRLLDVARTADVAPMLAAGLAENDPLAAQSLRVLSDEGLAPPDTEKWLRAAAKRATETFLIRVAQALHAVTGDESWATPIASVLTSNAFWGVRIDAAMALAAFTPTPALVESLIAGIHDEEYLVRYHCANTMLRYAGRKKDLWDYRSLFDRIATPSEGDPTDADRAKWTEAAAKLTALVNGGAGNPGKRGRSS